MSGDPTYLFLDIEATGLDHAKGSILEVAMILCDEDLSELDRYEVVVRPLPGYDQMDDYVRDMHTRNGLLKEIEERGVRRYQAEELLCQVIEASWKNAMPKRLVIAGNSVHFDKFWLREHMPKLHAMLHYRILDVTSLGYLAQIADWKTFSERPRPDDNHRAMADAQNSLDAVRYYVARGIAPKEVAP